MLRILHLKNNLLHFFCLLFLFVYPFLKFIWHDRYPFFKPEVMLFVLLGLIAALSLFFFARHPAVIAYIYSLLFLFLLTTGTDSIPPFQLYLRGGVVFFLFFLFWKIPGLLPKLLVVFILGVLLTDFSFWLINFNREHIGVIQSRESAVRFGPLPKMVLYMILDEHIGVDGMPKEVLETASMQDKLKNFYAENNFDLYTKAFSNYYYSDNSISNVLNGTYSDEQDYYFKGDREEGRNLRDNRIFDYFRDQGYFVQVYQANYINYCAQNAPFAKCMEYKKNSISSLLDQPYSTLNKMWVIGSLFLATNSIFREMDKRMIDRDLVKIKTGGLSVVPKVFHELKEDIQKAKGDTFFFVHLLMPHYPYVYDSECSPRPVSEWKNRHQFPENNLKNSDEGYRERYRLYYSQIDCLNRHLKDLFDFLKSEGLFDDTTLVLHGDHGSRINRHHEPYYDFYNQISDQDMITSHSTLLAVKLPGALEGNVISEMGDLTEILESLLWEKKTYKTDGENFVFLKQKKGKKELKKVPMPVF